MDRQRDDCSADGPRDEAGRDDGHAPEAVHRASGRAGRKACAAQHQRGRRAEQLLPAGDRHEGDRAERDAELHRGRVDRHRARDQDLAATDVERGVHRGTIQAGGRRRGSGRASCEAALRVPSRNAAPPPPPGADPAGGRERGRLGDAPPAGTTVRPRASAAQEGAQDGAISAAVGRRLDVAPPGASARRSSARAEVADGERGAPLARVRRRDIWAGVAERCTEVRGRDGDAARRRREGRAAPSRARAASDRSRSRASARLRTGKRSTLPVVSFRASTTRAPRKSSTRNGSASSSSDEHDHRGSRTKISAGRHDEERDGERNPSTATSSRVASIDASARVPSQRPRSSAPSSRPSVARLAPARPDERAPPDRPSASRPARRTRRYSHSIVAGGFDEMSSATRFTPGISLMIRLEMTSSRSYGRRAQSAVIASSEVTARMTIG